MANPVPLYEKKNKIQQTQNRRKLPQYQKGHICIANVIFNGERWKDFPIANVIFNGERWKDFPLRYRNKAKIPTFITSVQHSIGNTVEVLEILTRAIT